MNCFVLHCWQLFGKPRFSGEEEDNYHISISEINDMVDEDSGGDDDGDEKDNAENHGENTPQPLPSRPPRSPTPPPQPRKYMIQEDVRKQIGSRCDPMGKAAIRTRNIQSPIQHPDRTSPQAGTSMMDLPSFNPIHTSTPVTAITTLPQIRTFTEKDHPSNITAVCSYCWSHMPSRSLIPAPCCSTFFFQRWICPRCTHNTDIMSSPCTYCKFPITIQTGAARGEEECIPYYQITDINRRKYV